MRTTSWIVLLVFVFVAVGVTSLLVHEQWIVGKRRIETDEKARIDKINSVNKLYDLYNNLNNKNGYNFLIETLKESSIDNKLEFTSKAKLKYSTILFNEAEELVSRAKLLQLSLANKFSNKSSAFSSTPPVRNGNDIALDPERNLSSNNPVEMPERLHPLVDDLLNQAVKKYEMVKLLCDELKELDDVNYNYNYFFLKGEIYHRYFLIFSDDQTFTEYFNQTLTHYKGALGCRDGDTPTTINIELLLNQHENLMKKMQNSPQQFKTSNNRILNQAGFSNLKGN